MPANNDYVKLLQDIKLRNAHSRYAAARLVNQEQLKLYYGIGRLLDEKITRHKWGDKVLKQVEKDLKEETPSLRGFSYRNLKNMRQFYTSYKDAPIGPLLMAQTQAIDNVSSIIGQSATAQLKSRSKRPGQSSTGAIEDVALRSFMAVTFTHHLLLLNKCGTYDERVFYMHQIATDFWSVVVTEHHIKENLFRQIGKLHHNFDTAIPEASAVANELFKDQYLLDFLQLQESDNEDKMEERIVGNITEFILRMGKGFAFIGNQFRLQVDGYDFFVDLLFYNRILNRLVVFELKRDAFKPEYTGQLHFYLNVIDDKIKLPQEHATIGIILCRQKSSAIVQYSMKDISKPMGVATYINSVEPPAEIKAVLPNADDLTELL